MVNLQSQISILPNEPLTFYLIMYIIILMSSFLKSLIISFASLIIFSGPVLAQTIEIKDVPKPQSGFVESDFAKDVKDGIQSIENDNDGQNNQKQIDENEVDEGQQENEDVHTDEQIDQDEAQEEQEGAEGQSEQEEIKGNENGKDTSVQDENGKEQKEQKDSGTNSTNSKDTNED